MQIDELHLPELLAQLSPLIESLEKGFGWSNDERS